MAPSERNKKCRHDMQVTTRGVASGVTVMALLVWGVIALPGPEHRGALDVTGTWSFSIKLENYASGSAVFRQDGRDTNRDVHRPAGDPDNFGRLGVRLPPRRRGHG